MPRWRTEFFKFGLEVADITFYLPPVLSQLDHPSAARVSDAAGDGPRYLHKEPTMHTTIQNGRRIDTIGNVQMINGIKYVCTSACTLRTLELRLRLLDNAVRLGLRYNENGQVR